MTLRFFAITLLLSVGACAHAPPQAPGTPDDPHIQVTGVLTEEGVECPALRDRDGELYTLAGDTGRFRPGDPVTVRGTRAEASICQQGTTINVQSIERAP